MKFDKEYILGFLFSDQKLDVCMFNKNDIYDGLCIDKQGNKESDGVILTKEFKSKGIEVDSESWRIVTELLNVGQKWKQSIYIGFIDEKLKTDDFYSIECLPKTLPRNVWLLKMVLDPCVYQTSLNQILMY